MMLLLLLLPVLCSSYYQCFYARLRFKCAKDEYWGPVAVSIYNEKSLIFGGDERQWTKDQWIKIGEYKGIFEIDYKRDGKCPEPFNPYLVITSFCEPAEESEKGVIKEWVDYFKSKFVENKDALRPIFQVGAGYDGAGLSPNTTCRRIPAINNWTEIPIQLHANDDC